MSSQFSAPENLLREVRENVLGWTQGRLAEVAKGQGNLVSIKTISRLEGGTETYARTTFTKVFLAISEGLAKAGKPEMDFAQIFPKLISHSDAKKPPVTEKKTSFTLVKTPAQNS